MKKLIIAFLIGFSALFAEDFEPENFDFSSYAIDSMLTAETYYYLAMPDWRQILKIYVTEICPLPDNICKIVFNNTYVYYLLGDSEISMGSYEYSHGQYFVKFYYRVKSFTYNKIELEFIRGECIKSHTY